MQYAEELFSKLNRVNSSNVKMLYDIYHQKMMGDFSLDDIKTHIDRMADYLYMIQQQVKMAVMFLQIIRL